MTTLPDLLQRAAEQNPQQPVFVRRESSTTYGELELASGRLASGLRRLGVVKGDRVALLLDASVEYIVGYYGILKAGGTVVPLSSDTRTRSLVYALEHSEAKAALLDAKNLQYLSGQTGELPLLKTLIYRGESRVAESALGERGHFELVALPALLATSGDGDSGCAIDATALASITYTSGTTGKPKGVMLTHGNLVSNTRSIIEYLELTPRDRVAMVLPFHYAYGNSVLHTHIAAGATIVAAGAMTYPVQVLESIATHRCTGFSGVPSMLARLIELSGFERHDVSSLRYVTQAGAAMTPALAARLQSAFPSARLFVMYGQTEATARLAYLPPDDLKRKVGSAGKAIPGVELRILGPDGAELPRGATGEIVARGDNVMQGYWRDPEQTARVLRPTGLHTGDLGRMDEEGFIFIVGRESEMIKSGAHRISPREIEEVIQGADGVRDCAVLGVPDEQLGQAILAVVVAAPGHEIDRQRLLRHCLNELPRYKLPAHLMPLPELPRTAAGKVSRRELLELYQSRQAEQTEQTPVPAGATT
jgi:acyl-CoA synthetase (AMP-forming)/AMP-acid ligase II